MERVFGSGGPHSARVWWPAGLEQLSMARRVEALRRGWWIDENPPERAVSPVVAKVFRDGRRVLLAVGGETQ